MRKISLLDKENREADLLNAEVDDTKKRARLTSPIKVSRQNANDSAISSFLKSPSCPFHASPSTTSTKDFRLAVRTKLVFDDLPSANPSQIPAQNMEDDFFLNTLKSSLPLSPEQPSPPGSPSISFLKANQPRRRSAPESAQHREEEMDLFSRPPASAPPQMHRRQVAVLPKVQRDETGDFLIFDHTRYQLEVLATDINRRHRVYIARTDTKEFVLKLYPQINKDTRLAIMKGEISFYENIQKFLKAHVCPNFRLADIYTNPLNDGLLLMEYVKGDNDFWKEWKGAKSMDGLSEKSVRILTIARHLFETMWKSNTHLGDFRAENVIWDGQDLVYIDWENDFENSQEQAHIRKNLMILVDEWALGNESVKSFLTANLKN